MNIFGRSHSLLVKSKFPLVNKLINPLVRVIPKNKFLEEEKI